MVSRHKYVLECDCPSRLKGLTIVAVVWNNNIDFEIVFPFDPTPEETSWLTNFFRGIMDKFGIPYGVKLLTEEIDPNIN
jgi:hypothetical protein